MMFTIFDIIIFAIITLSTIMGLYKGLLGIAVNLLGFVASIVTAIFLFPYVKLAFTGHIENALLLSILSGTIAYVCSLFILTSITSRISGLLSGISCGFFDRTLGTLVGFLRGLLISTIIFVLIAIFSSGAYLKAQNVEEIISNINAEKYPTWLIDSKTTSYLERSLKKLLSLFSEDTLKSIKLPTPNTEKNLDIIDAIKSRKGQDSTSSVVVPASIDKNLENAAEASEDLIDEND